MYLYITRNAFKNHLTFFGRRGFFFLCFFETKKTMKNTEKTNETVLFTLRPAAT